ncbi:MAG: EboA domain-containing protein [Chitinophagaceae bacterium]|nr:EboA domain-containing protein [Chitinophagaceae bacterium]MCW5927201.1 EboA domain-containing protein [Chitinophagaceae bacterium]
MFTYPVVQLRALLGKIIPQHISPETWEWLQATGGPGDFNKKFVLLPRKTGKTPINLSAEDGNKIREIRQGFSVEGYTIDRLCRVWLLLQLDETNEAAYIRAIENLFQAAEVNELVTLYGSLPVLAYPEKWTGRCAEGIRSNIGVVLEAIICDNPYPSEYLDEAAWNQLVLKAFFTEKDVNRITGLDARSNKTLADTLSDFAHERWAASRPVPLLQWRCVAGFIDVANFADIEKVVASENPVEQKAGLLACYHSHYPPAKALLSRYPEIKNAIESGNINWHSITEDKNVPVA